VPIFQKNGDPYLALDGTPSTFTVVGVESKRYQQAKRAHAKRVYQMVKRSGGQSLDPSLARVEDIKLLGSAVIEFHGWDDGKKDLPLTPENTTLLLNVPHIFDQVQAGVGAHADFSSASSGG